MMNNGRVKSNKKSGWDQVIKKSRRFTGILVRAEHEAAGLANQGLLAVGTGNRHVRLIESDMCFVAAGPKRSIASFAHQGLFTEAAFEHGCPFAC
jgi:hypothetical protein